MGNYIIAAVLMGLSIVYIYATSQLASYEVGDPLGSKVFPFLLGTGMVLAALLLLLETYRARGKGSHRGEKGSKKNRHLAVIGAVVCWTVIFIMSLESLGFLLSTSVYLIVFMSYLNPKKILLHIIVSIVVSGTLYAVLVKGLGVSLAKGIVYF